MFRESGERQLPKPGRPSFHTPRLSECRALVNEAPANTRFLTVWDLGLSFRGLICTPSSVETGGVLSGTLSVPGAPGSVAAKDAGPASQTTGAFGVGGLGFFRVL